MRRTLIWLPALILAIAAAALFLASHPTRAIDIPEMHFDMDTTGTTYTPGTAPAGNIMNVGPIDLCLTSTTADPNTHQHNVHLILKNAEDVVSWTARVNYIGDQMAIVDFTATPYTDGVAAVGFINLPEIPSHRSITPAIEGNAFPAIPADGSNTPQTTAFGAIYNGAQTDPVSPDTPHKTTPDDASYNAPTGGVLALVVLEVTGNESGNLLTMNLDDNFPNGALASELEIFTGTGQMTVPIPVQRLGDGFHAEGATATCPVPPGPCVTTECPASGVATPTAAPTAPPGQPTATPAATATPGPGAPTATAGPGGATPTRTATPAGGAAAGTRTATPRASPAALPPTGTTSDGDSIGFAYLVLLIAGLVVPGSGAAFALWRLRRTGWL